MSTTNDPLLGHRAQALLLSVSGFVQVNVHFSSCGFYSIPLYNQV